MAPIDIQHQVALTVTTLREFKDRRQDPTVRATLKDTLALLGAAFDSWVIKLGQLDEITRKQDLWFDMRIGVGHGLKYVVRILSLLRGEDEGADPQRRSDLLPRDEPSDMLRYCQTPEGFSRVIDDAIWHIELASTVENDWNKLLNGSQTTIGSI